MRDRTAAANWLPVTIPTTTVLFSTEEVADIDVIVYDVLGRLVSRLAARSFYPGEYSVVWNGANESGMVMPSGMYYVRMSAVAKGGPGSSDAVRFTATRKMLLMK